MRTSSPLIVLAGVLLAAPAPAQNLVFQPTNPATIAESLKGATGIATGDVNGDGKPDIAVAGHPGLVLLLGSPGGQFQPGIPLVTAFSSNAVVLADFNRDGKLDLAAYASDEKKVYVLKGNGDGTFQQPVPLSTLEAPQGHVNGGGLIAADLNQDGVPDLAAVQGTSLAVFFNNGDGSFEPGVQLVTGAYPTAVVAADFNADGVADLAVSSLLSANVTVLLGSGRGAFRTPVNVSARGYARGVTAADINKDGKTDLAVATETGVLILLGNGDGSFRQGAIIASDSSPLSIAAGDLNGDGAPDLVVGNYYGGTIDILTGSGDGSFQALMQVPALGDVPGVAIADLNLDSKPDVVAASHSAGTALLALGTGDGRFQPPAYFGLTTNAFVRPSNAGLLAGIPLRKSLFLLRPAAAPLSVEGVTDYPVDAQFGDFNGDGTTDLLVATAHILPTWRGGSPGEDAGCRLLAFPGRGAGGFGAAVVTPIERCPAVALELSQLLLVTGDFTGTRGLDIAVANNAAGAIQLYRGRGDGSFALANELPSNQVTSFASADVDGDGISDLAATHQPEPGGAGLLAVYLGAAGGRLSPGRTVGECKMPWNVVTGDFNGDFRPDLALACGDYVTPTEIPVFMNAGGGAFQAAPRIPLAFTTGRAMLVAADFDGDRKQDLVALEAYAREGNPWAHAGLLLLGNGDGTFRGAGAIAGLPGPAAAIAMSWDADGRPDLAVLGAANGTVNPMRNTLAAGALRAAIAVSAASFLPGPLAAESIATAFGQALSEGTDAAQSQPLPTRLAGLTVNVTDSTGQTRAAGLLFVSPDQVNFVVPAGTASGAAVVTLLRDGAAPAQFLAPVAISAPGIFTANSNGQGVPAAQALHVKPDGAQVPEPVYQCGNTAGSCAPAAIDLGAEAERVYLILYGTGIRHCTYANVRIGGVDAVVEAAGPQRQYAGLDQINVLLPRELAGRGDLDVVLQSCGRTANTVRISVK